jgi:EamA-like transporter family.
LRLHQSVTRRQQLGLVAAFVGICMVGFGQGGEAAGLSGTTLAGVAFMLLSSLAIAFYYVWSVELTDAHGTAAVAAWSTLFGFLALLPWAGREMAQTDFEVTAVAVGAAVYLGVVVTVAGLFLWLALLRVVAARVAASVQYLQPLVGIAAAAVLFGDRLGLAFAVGVLLVLAGLALTLAPARANSAA